jgi:hypothetical protein
MAEPPLRRVRPRLWRLQFSLAGIFVLMTLASVAVWVWYQWPYAVENKQIYDGDPFAPSTKQSSAFFRREVEYVRRVWGGTVRHGPRRVYDAQDNLLISENYRNGQEDGDFIAYNGKGGKKSLVTYRRGQKHGPSRQWDSSGQVTQEENYSHGLRHGPFVARQSAAQTLMEGAFDEGRPSGKWTWFPRGGAISGQWRDGQPDGRWEWRDANDRVYLTADFDRGKVTTADGAKLNPSLPKFMANATSAEPRAFLALFATINFNVSNKPLKDAVTFLQNLGNLPIVMDYRKLEMAGISQDARVTCQVEQTPLVIALGTMLEPIDLGCDFRYGMLCIDTLDSIARWKDETGVTQLVPPRGSQLAREWSKSIDLDGVVEMPLKDLASFLTHKHGVRFDLSRLPQPRDKGPDLLTVYTPVTAPLRGISFRDALATILDRIGGKATLQGETIVLEPQ